MRARGFTVVELVATILLIGIIAATGYSRWFGRDDYDANASVVELTSMARYAQRAALAKQDADIELRVDRQGDEWRFIVLDNDGGTLVTLHDNLVDAGNTTLAVTAGIGPVNLSGATQLVIRYDGLGNASAVTIGGAAGDPQNGVLVAVTGGGVQQMCVSPIGYAHKGGCV